MFAQPALNLNLDSDSILLVFVAIGQSLSQDRDCRAA